MNGLAWLWVGLTIYGLTLIFALALCKSAAAADRQAETMMKEKEHSE